MEINFENILKFLKFVFVYTTDGEVEKFLFKKVIPYVYTVLYSFKAFMLIIYHMNLQIILEVNKAVTFPTV